jgi:predicted HD superfamily hydrolase involved in NAD metabolism
LGVGHAALRLALHLGEDPQEALMAGLLHDVAKEEKPSFMRKMMTEAPEWADEDDGHFPSIWHAIVSAIVAVKEFGAPVSVGRAIRFHPTGSPNMTTLEKILFLADYVEPTRTWPGVVEMRELAYRDFEEAVRTAIIKKTEHVRSKSKPLHPRSLRALVTAERR